MSRSKKNSLQEFISAHALCCFCGGSNATESIDHVPNKALFRGNLRPKSHEFPACNRCNQDSREWDQVAAVALLTMGSISKQQSNFEEFKRLFRGVKNNVPQAIEYIAGANATPILYLRNGLLRPATATLPDPRLFTDFLNPWVAKLGLALWYQHVGGIFPENGRIFVKFFTNWKLSQINIVELSANFCKNFGELRQGNVGSSNTFWYQYAVEVGLTAACFIPVFRENSAAFIGLYPSPDADSIFFQNGCFETNRREGLVFCAPNTNT